MADGQTFKGVVINDDIHSKATEVRAICSDGTGPLVKYAHPSDNEDSLFKSAQASHKCDQAKVDIAPDVSELYFNFTNVPNSNFKFHSINGICANGKSIDVEGITNFPKQELILQNLRFAEATCKGEPFAPGKTPSPQDSPQNDKPNPFRPKTQQIDI